jgi:hypothetical protein
MASWYWRVKLDLRGWRCHRPLNCTEPLTQWQGHISEHWILNNTTVKTSNLTEDRTCCVGIISVVCLTVCDTSYLLSVPLSVTHHICCLSHCLWHSISVVCPTVCDTASASTLFDWFFFSKCCNWDFHHELLQNNNFQLYSSKIKQQLVNNKLQYTKFWPNLIQEIFKPLNDAGV